MLSSPLAGPAAPCSPSRLRRGAASAALAAAATGFAWSAVTEDDFLSLRWELAGMAGLMVLASLGSLRRGVLAQVFSRGLAWLVCLPAMAGVLGEALRGHAPDAAAAGFAASTGLALWLSWPNLNTEPARREFAPVAYRRTFLAGAVASVTAGAVAALGAAGSLWAGSPREGLELSLLAAAMLATSLGVVRMRSWGVLLGLATSVAMLGETLAHLGDLTAWGYAMAAVPGLLLAAPLLLSRLRAEPPAKAAPVVRASRAAALPDLRVRVADAPASAEEPGSPWESEALAGRAE